MNEYENEVKKLDEQLEQAIQKQTDALFNQEYEAAIENNLSYSEFSRKIVELSRRCNPDRLRMTLRNKLYNFEKEFKVPIITKEPPIPDRKIEVEPFFNGLYAGINGLGFIKNDSLSRSYDIGTDISGTYVTLSDIKPKINFNLNGLSQEEVFELTNNVVTGAAEQLINLQKDKTYEDAIEQMDVIEKNMRKQNLGLLKQRVNNTVLLKSKEILEDRMKNTLVK